MPSIDHVMSNFSSNVLYFEQLLATVNKKHCCAVSSMNDQSLDCTTSPCSRRMILLEDPVPEDRMRTHLLTLQPFFDINLRTLSCLLIVTAQSFGLAYPVLFMHKT